MTHIDEPGQANAVCPASATITSTYRLGRLLRGVPLAVAIYIRQIILADFVDDGLARRTCT